MAPARLRVTSSSLTSAARLPQALRIWVSTCAISESPSSTMYGGMPYGDVVGPAERFDHVVAGATQELLQRHLQRVGSGATDACANYLECHERVP